MPVHSHATLVANLIGHTLNETLGSSLEEVYTLGQSCNIGSLETVISEGLFHLLEGELISLDDGKVIIHDIGGVRWSNVSNTSNLDEPNKSIIEGLET